MSASDSKRNGGRIGVDFIDVLFAIVMGISATVILDEPWFNHESSFEWQTVVVFEICVLLLGYSTLITSWVGYHQSVGNDPQEISNVPQWITFLIDIVLLACYLVILVKFDNFGFVLAVLVLVFSLYVVWDIFCKMQLDTVDNRRRQRMGVSRFWAIFFAILLVIFHWLNNDDGSLGLNNWVFLSLALGAIILYRVHKEQLWLKPILDLLMLQWPQRKVAG